MNDKTTWVTLGLPAYTGNSTASIHRYILVSSSSKGSEYKPKSRTSRLKINTLSCTPEALLMVAGMGGRRSTSQVRQCFLRLALQVPGGGVLGAQQ